MKRVHALEGGPAEAIVLSHPAGWRPYRREVLHRATRRRTARDGTDPSAPNGDGELPTRIRHTGPTGPAPGRTSLDTVELPVARATRRHP